MFAYRKAMGALFALALLGSQPALADTLQTFTLSGTFSNGSELGGSLIINTTTGVVTSVAIRLTTPWDTTISSITSQGGASYYNASVYPYTVLAQIPSTPDTLWLSFDATTLVGYSGGAFYSSTNPVSYDTNNHPLGSHVSGQYGIQVAMLDSGSATAAAVPEPASLALLGTGVLGLAAATRRRRAA